MTAVAFEVNDLAFQNGDVLAALDESPNGRIGSVAELGRMLGRDKSNLTKTLAKLVDAGIIADPPLSGLTPEGEAQLAAWRRARDPSPAGEQTALVSELVPDPDQPRQDFDIDALADLADSIADKGLLQPILVRPADDAGRRMIVAGERRYRALVLLVMSGRWPEDKPVPIRIATPEDEAEAMELALVENTQRIDLNHMELALGYQRLADLGRTPKQIAAVVGRTNDHVTQHLRLTRLDPDDQAAVAAGDLPLHQALEKLRAGGAQAAEGGDATKPAEPPVEWTVYDIYRTPFAAEDGGTDPMLTIWIMHDNRGGYRIDWRGDLGEGSIDHTGSEVLANVNLALGRSITGIRSRGALERPLSEWLDRLQGPFFVNGVDYYNAARAQEARYTLGWDERKANSGGGAVAGTGGAGPGPQTQPSPLSPRARLALIELAHKVAAERRPLNPADDPAWTGDREADHAAFGASVGAYWLDGVHGELTAARLAAFSQVRGGLPPVASLTPAGVAFLIDAAIDLPVDDRALERVRLASGFLHDVDVTYDTAWLEQVAQPHAETGGGADGDPADAAADPWDRTPEQIAEDERLDGQVAQLLAGDPLVDAVQIFADFGVAAAETRDTSDDDTGLVFLLSADGTVVTTLTVDQPGELPASRARALADLVAHQLNGALA